MNDDISNIAGTVTHYLSDTNQLDLVNSDFGIGRIVVLSPTVFAGLKENYTDNDPSSPSYNIKQTQNVMGFYESGTGQIGQNISGKTIPAGAILCPKRGFFSYVELTSGFIEVHLLMPQKYTSRKYPAE